MTVSSPTQTSPEAKEETEKKSFIFYPFAYALLTDELHAFCWYCLKTSAHFKRCNGCHFAVFCNKGCFQLGWKDHKAECKGFSNVDKVPDIETRMLGRILIRYKAIYSGKDKADPEFYRDRTSNRGVMDIWSHSEKMSKDPAALAKFEEIYKQLEAFYGVKHLMSKETVWQLHCRNYINRHAICDSSYTKEIGKGLYLDLCQYDHSCRPNTIYTCDGFRTTLRSLLPGLDMSNLKTTHYAYIDLLSALAVRRKELRDTWYFECECDRCTDLDDHLLTAVYCPSQIHQQRKERVPLCIFGMTSYKDPQTLKITCPQCNQILSNEFVAMSIETMRNLDKTINEDIKNVIFGPIFKQLPEEEQREILRGMLAQFTLLFPPTNLYLAKVIQPCVRLAFPCNHPAVAFHLRSTGVFLSNVEQHEEALIYLQESCDMICFVWGKEHSLAAELLEMVVSARQHVEDQKKVEALAKMAPEKRREYVFKMIEKKSNKDVKVAMSEDELAKKMQEVNLSSDLQGNDINTEDFEKKTKKEVNSSTEKSMKQIPVFLYPSSDEFDDIPELVE